MTTSYETCLAVEKFQGKNDLSGLRDKNGNIIEPAISRVRFGGIYNEFPIHC